MALQFRTDTPQRTRTTQRPVNEPSPYSYDALPAELREYPNFVLWRLVNGKKIPFSPHINSQARIHLPASSTDPTSWGTFEDAVHILTVGLLQRSKEGKLYRLYPDGIGFVLTHTPFVGLDFDGSVTDATVAPGVLSLVTHTYTEYSQSGQGVKAIGRGSLVAAVKTDAVEMYNYGRFFALTGRTVAHTAPMIADLQPSIDALVKLYRPNGQRARMVRASGTSGDTGDLNWAFVRWLERNPLRLWHADGMPHVALLACSASQQLYELLDQGTIPASLAAFNDSDSERRAVIAFTTQKLGMLPEERYVLLRTLTTRYGWDDQKNERQLNADYERLIFDVYPVKDDRIAGVSRKRLAAFEAEPTEAAPISTIGGNVREKRPAHRPAGDKARQIERTHKLLDHLADPDGVIHNVSTIDLADEFKKFYPGQRSISRSSMRDYLRAGRDMGLWVAEQENGNGRLVVTLKQRVICHPKLNETATPRVTAQFDELSVPTPQTDVNSLQCNKEEGENTVFLSGAVSVQQPADESVPIADVDVSDFDQAQPSTPTETMGDQHKKAVFSPQGVSLPSASSLSQAIRFTLAAIAETFATVSTQTGEIRPGVATKVRVRLLITSAYGNRWSDDAIDRALLVERKRLESRKRIAGWDKFRQKVREMSGTALRKASQAAASAFVQASKKGNSKAEYYRIRSVILADEEARRAELDEGEATLYALADAALDALRDQLPVRQPQPIDVAPVEISNPYPSGYVTSMIERLKARKELINAA